MTTNATSVSLHAAGHLFSTRGLARECDRVRPASSLIHGNREYIDTLVKLDNSNRCVIFTQKEAI